MPPAFPNVTAPRVAIAAPPDTSKVLPGVRAALKVLIAIFPPSITSGCESAVALPWRSSATSPVVLSVAPAPRVK